MRSARSWEGRTGSMRFGGVGRAGHSAARCVPGSCRGFMRPCARVVRPAGFPGGYLGCGPWLRGLPGGCCFVPRRGGRSCRFSWVAPCPRTWSCPSVGAGQSCALCAGGRFLFARCPLAGGRGGAPGGAMRSLRSSSGVAQLLRSGGCAPAVVVRSVPERPGFSGQARALRGAAPCVGFSRGCRAWRFHARWWGSAGALRGRARCGGSLCS